jgi:hypothetical protein
MLMCGIKVKAARGIQCMPNSYISVSWHIIRITARVTIVYNTQFIYEFCFTEVEADAASRSPLLYPKRKYNI